jgi:hypothetical protein
MVELGSGEGVRGKWRGGDVEMWRWGDVECWVWGVGCGVLGVADEVMKG